MLWCKKHPWVVGSMVFFLLAMALLAILVKSELTDPQFDFSISAIIPKDVNKLMLLSGQLKQVKEWSPAAVDFAWSEEIRAENGQLVVPDVQTINDLLLPYVNTVKTETRKILSETMGMDVTFEVKKMDNGQWLRLNPFSFYFSAEARIPNLPFRMGLNDILVDADGIHFSLFARRT
jgi:hypothetical protein